MNLRDYQNDLVGSIVQQWDSGTDSTLAVLYTGGGKTVCFADLIRKVQPKRALVLAHREELIYQACHKIKAVTGFECEIEMAGQRASTNLFHNSPVVVATVQTLISGQRMQKFRPTDFGVIICDEAHHYVSPSFVRVLDYFRQNPAMRIAGFTATPKRADETALGKVFKSVAYTEDILDGIKKGWLCDVTQQFVQVSSLDYSHIKTVAGDFNSAQLKAVMEAEENIAGVCQPALEVLYGLPPHTLKEIPVPDWRAYIEQLKRTPRRAIMFTVSVAQAEASAGLFNRVVPHLAEWVCGKTDKIKRKEILDRFSKGETHVVMNCGVLTEGYDNPAVEVIFMARPTKSESLYRQMVGRSTRTLPGVVDGIETAEARKEAIAKSAKPFCRIIDFSGNSGRHRLISCMDILGGKMTDEAKAKAIAKAKAEGKPVRVSVALTNAEVACEEERKAKAERQRIYEEARKKHLVPKSHYGMRDVNPFERLGIAPASGRVRYGTGKPASEKQIKFLRRFMRGVVPHPERLSAGEAGRLIGEKMAKWEGNNSEKLAAKDVHEYLAGGIQ